MPSLTNKSRLPLSLLLLISFFIPASNNMSAFNFIGLALREAEAETDITTMDAFVITTPLILILVVAIVILIRSVRRVPIRKTVSGLPLLLLIFFFAVLSFTNNSNHVQVPGTKFLSSLQIGFYLAAMASVLLLFTKNSSRRRRTKKRKQATGKELEVAVKQDV